MTRAVLILAAALLASFSLTGCLGNEPRLTHQEYEHAMQAIARDMNGNATEIREASSAPSADAFIELFADVRDLVREAADRVGDINPPEEIDEPHHELADALNETADVLDRVVDRAEDGDLFGAMSALEDAPDDIARRVREAIAEIRTAGYYIGDGDDWG
jgi:hypothetical protein